LLLILRPGAFDALVGPWRIRCDISRPKPVLKNMAGERSAAPASSHRRRPGEPCLGRNSSPFPCVQRPYCRARRHTRRADGLYLGQVSASAGDGANEFPGRCRGSGEPDEPRAMQRAASEARALIAEFGLQKICRSSLADQSVFEAWSQGLWVAARMARTA